MSEERLKEIKHSLDFQEIMLISERETYDADLEGVEELLKEEKDLYNEVIRLQQENKQLKSILTELEEWLKEPEYFNGRKLRQDYITVMTTDVLDKIQELKEKYK